MAIQSANVIRAACDGCPAVVYAESPAKPKGVTGSVQVVDGNGRETNASFFACQVQHVGAAVRNVTKTAKSVPATDFAPAAVGQHSGVFATISTPGVPFDEEFDSQGG